MRNFIFGGAVGAIVAIALVKLVPFPNKSTQGERRAPSVHSAATGPICGRDTFNINVAVARLFPGAGPDDKDPVVAAVEKRQEALARGLEDRLSRSGLRHELACPVILDVFGMAHENAQGEWIVSAKVSLEAGSYSKLVYPSWNSGEYRASFRHVTEAQADLERALTERVERFLEYFAVVQPVHE